MHGLAVIHQRRHCLSMVIWWRDAFVTYLPFDIFTSGHGNWLSQEPARRIFTSILQSNFTLYVFRILMSEQVRIALQNWTSGQHANEHAFQGLFSHCFTYWFVSQRCSTPPVRLNVIVVSRPVHSATKFAMTSFGKCVTHVDSTWWHEPFAEYLVVTDLILQSDSDFTLL